MERKFDGIKQEIDDSKSKHQLNTKSKPLSKQVKAPSKFNPENDNPYSGMNSALLTQ